MNLDITNIGCGSNFYRMYQGDSTLFLQKSESEGNGKRRTEETTVNQLHSGNKLARGLVSSFFSSSTGLRQQV